MEDEIIQDVQEKISWKSKKYLLNPDLFNLITEQEFDKKIVGEIETRKVIFLCSCGRLIQNSNIASYNLLVNDDAGIGKDYVVSKVLDILPKDKENQIYIHKTRISPTVFNYWHNSKFEPDWTWDGKVFYPEDISENVLNSDVFKVMSSSGSEATITINNRAVDIDIKGKPVIISTTATSTPNPELTRRYAILSLDSSTDQTKAIMKRHSEYKMNGIVPDYSPWLIESLGKLQRIKVKIPFAYLIDQYFPDNNIMMRTNYPRFLDYICASTGLYQFQREKDSEGFFLATGQDYDVARKCFLKLFSNKYMISLTINQKKILKEFEENPNMKGSVAQLHPRINFISDKALQYNLGILSKYGILDSYAGQDSLNRDREMYRLAGSYKPNEKINIPTFDELCRNTSISSESSLTPITSISSTTKTFKRDTEDIEDIEPLNRATLRGKFIK